jgi:hypothetical protein
MRLAENVVVHDPEVNSGRIDSERLRAHGWSEEVVEQQIRRRQESANQPAIDISSTLPKAD